MVFYHEGERAVQRRAGWTRANWGSASVTSEVPAVGAEFLRQQRMLLIGATDARAAAWATMLTGPPGFVTATNERTIVVAGRPNRDDPLAASLAEEIDIGLLAIEPRTRRRMRINGRSRPEGHGLIVHTDQVYPNCPKYIHARQSLPDAHEAADPGPTYKTKELTAEQQRWISTADTFFVATSAREHGADVSHRGGNPGFVRVLDRRRLVWPDYVGNSMYMTLGNLDLNPSCGLLFVDWAHGHTLHLTGDARIDWDPDHAAAVPGAQRLIEFSTAKAVQINHNSPLRWAPGELFRHNPATPTRAVHTHEIDD
jgi:predicted pyridoxine 5'-phosphate oxidase superfamily flavin-nucleotide-binding protein